MTSRLVANTSRQVAKSPSRQTLITGVRGLTRRLGDLATWRLVIPALFAALSLSGCAYYNGVYNAKHFAKQAEASERAGRTSEAADRWRVAAMHAESVQTRHPHSRWVDDAMLIRARALVHLESWSDAAVVAEQAVRKTRSPEQRAEAWLYLGLANNGLRQPASALTAFDSATGSRRSAMQSEAMMGRGRALMAMGRPRDALADFERSRGDDAGFERTRAALAAGDGLRAAEFADSLALRQPFHEAQWLMLLDSLASASLQARVTGLTDALRVRPDVRAGSRARLLLADGERQLRAGNDAAAAERFREVQRVAGDSLEAGVASVRLTGLDIRAAESLADLRGARRRLSAIGPVSGAAGAHATDLARLLDEADTLLAQTRAPDAFWYLRAELLRDSLRAPGLAAAAFAEMPARFPDSPWTPKGMLAAIALGHPAADSLRALLFARYAASPYALAARGSADAPERYASLEDSLRVVLETAPRVAAPGRAVVEDRDPADRAPRPAPTDAPRPAVTPPRSTTRPSIDP